MSETLEVWVEVLPTTWPHWRSIPWGVRVGRVLKRRPKGADIHNFKRVVIEVDLVARFASSRGIEVK